MFTSEVKNKEPVDRIGVAEPGSACGPMSRCAIAALARALSRWYSA